MHGSMMYTKTCSKVLQVYESIIYRMTMTRHRLNVQKLTKLDRCVLGSMNTTASVQSHSEQCHPIVTVRHSPTYQSIGEIQRLMKRTKSHVRDWRKALKARMGSHFNGHPLVVCHGLLFRGPLTGIMGSSSRVRGA